MPIEHRIPTPATAKYLYAHAFRCAFMGCRRPLYRVDDFTSERTLNSTICHIHARRENGPRWNKDQTEAENRSPENLLLMCLEHSSAIDDAKSIDAYKPSLLKEWKAAQFEEFLQIEQGWGLNKEMAEEAIRSSFERGAILIRDSTVNLGGIGGSAPGAGGGGGGAIGHGARGGDGGGGGEMVSAEFRTEDLEKAGFESFEVKVGAPGVAGALPGQHAISGGDSEFIGIRVDGTKVPLVRARGGRGSRSSDAYLPVGVPEICGNDIDSGLRVISFLTANGLEFNNGLIYILGGGWSKHNVQKLPADVIWLASIVFAWDEPLSAETVGVYVTLSNPSDEEVSCVGLSIENASVADGNCQAWCRLGASLDAEGIWTFRVVGAALELTKFKIQVAKLVLDGASPTAPKAATKPTEGA